MNREQVYEIISSERDYQDRLKLDTTHPDIIPELHVGDTLSAIQLNLNKALESWYTESTPHEKTTVYLRKIAALCVQCMETYGGSPRI
jgi:hypothetical protein